MSLIDISLAGLRAPRLVKKDGRLRIEARVDADGLNRQRRYERIPVTRLDARKVGAQFAEHELTGYRPAGVPTIFTPKLAKADPPAAAAARKET